MFKKFVIDTETNLFDELLNSTKFEDMTKGRKGAVLVSVVPQINDDIVPINSVSIPIVRTTSIYNTPAQKFLPVHYNIMDKIRKKFKKNILFNNALIEIYDSSYRTMKFHTDQSLDLEENSYICLFSCYENDSIGNIDMRKLQIQNKTTKEYSDVILNHNSIVLFSTRNNHKHLHKIILESDKSKNKWLGITFRLSKTYINFINDVPYIYPSDKILRIANNNEKNEFYKHKANENLYSEYVYPLIDYTISRSDTMLPI